MTLNDFKDLLRNYPSMTEKVHSIENEIELAKEEAQATRDVGSITLDGMPHGNAISDPTYQKAKKVIDIYDERISKLLDDQLAIIRKQQRLADIIRDLTPDEYNVIQARYFKGIHWDFVPAAVNLSRRTCFRAHDRAMFKMIQGIESAFNRNINEK